MPNILIVTDDQINEAIRETYLSGRRLAVEWLSGKPLSLEHCFINLCIVDHTRDSDMRPVGDGSDKDLGAGHLPSKFSIDPRLKVENPPKSEQVSLKALFDLRNQKDGTEFRPNRVLIWGRAATGKTTLCKKMVHDFYHNGLWRDLYDRVVWLPLRRLKLMENEGLDIIGLIQKEFHLYGHENNLAARVQKVVIHGERTLFILDGLDEVSYKLDPDSSIRPVLGSLLARHSVIITSRPHSTSILNHNRPDLELETIGFSPEQVFLDTHFEVQHLLNPAFTGRDIDLQRLTTSFAAGSKPRRQHQRRFVLYGPGGMGKTQICLKFVQEQRDRYVECTSYADPLFLTRCVM